MTDHLPLAHCVSWDDLFNVSGLSFLLHKMRVRGQCIVGLIEGLNEFMKTKYLQTMLGTDKSYTTLLLGINDKIIIIYFIG